LIAIVEGSTSLSLTAITLSSQDLNLTFNLNGILAINGIDAE